MVASGFHIVLVEPEIPQNTGTIGRLCLGTGATLHLVKPLGFSIEAKDLKRAGLDYWEHLTVVTHESLQAFLDSLPTDTNKVFIETRAGATLYERTFPVGTYFIFGRETTGLPDWVLNENPLDLARIPMSDARVRSLNLSNAVSIVLYEAIRQSQFVNL